MQRSDEARVTMPRLDRIADTYRRALADARKRRSWRLRYRARRWRRAATTGGLDDFDVARLAALRCELRARGTRAVDELPPLRWPS